MSETAPLPSASDALDDKAASAPVVGIIMGSQSDWETMRHADALLTELEIPHETLIVSAHRTPDRLADYARTAANVD